VTTKVPYAGPEQALSVICGDSASPDVRAFPALADAVRHQDGPLGEAILWDDEPCTTWPIHAAESYTGPWNATTSAPILVVGNTGDPSTPFANSMLMAHELSQPRLLTVAGYGHTEFLNPQHLREPGHHQVPRRRAPAGVGDGVRREQAALRLRRYSLPCSSRFAGTVRSITFCAWIAPVIGRVVPSRSPICSSTVA
jgi:hypothetical protein